MEDDPGPDAVMVLPGIMGTELVHAATGRVLWGISDPRWLASAWTTGDSLRELALTEQEREGVVGRIKPTRLLRVPAGIPVLRGVEPYTALLAGVRTAAAHPDAVAEFPYDWRLPVAYNAARLADAAARHLERWRAHPRGSRNARLVLVAHSMGGLIARYLTGVLGDGGMVRTTLTLGTPFYGAVKAAYLLSTGEGSPVPLPRMRLRELVLGMPGLYDLLPVYRCLGEGDRSRRLTPADIAAIGGDPLLAEQSFAMHERLRRADGGGLRSLIGVGLPTMQSMSVVDGVVHPRYTIEGDLGRGARREDRRGDSTVYRDSASPPGPPPGVLPQSHAALAKCRESIAFVHAEITGHRQGPPMAGRGDEVRVDLPDVVAVGEPFDIVVETADGPAAVSCTLEEATTGDQLPPPLFVRRDGVLVATARVVQPGLYRVAVKQGSYSAVEQLMLAVPAIA
ncbi:lipase/acyltransferase domain-containing protein [Catellatospora chokoriensis]|uniref:lipase/acyltransferase domain-containing protein n=1 Tax=Catellatospora chokoriensis TaxID=310353 RepID=UPI0019459B70|nr:hypothetical protein [Catellatospora chokoriensis]